MLVHSFIQVLQKNTEVTESSWSRQVVPTRCKHMIKLVKYFETESTIYLLLEYAQGEVYLYMSASDSLFIEINH